MTDPSPVTDDGGTPGYVDTLPEMVAALRESPVVVESTMGNGHTEQVREHLLELAASAEAGGVQVFAVATTTPVGLDPINADEQLAVLLNDALGEPGVYVVETSLGGGHVATYGDLGTGSENVDSAMDLLSFYTHEEMRQAAADRWGEDDADLSSVSKVAATLEAAARVAEDGAFPQSRAESEGVPLSEVFDDLELLTPDEASSYASSTWAYATPDYDAEQSWSPATPGEASFAVTLTLLLVTALGYRLLQALTAWRAGPAGVAATTGRERGGRAGTGRTTDADEPWRALGYRHDPASLRRRAADRLERTDTELAGPLLRQLPADAVDLARGSIEEARRLLDAGPDERAAETGDDLAAVGAWVLAETAWSVVRRRGDGVWVPCFTNPTHGEGRTRAAVGGGLEVPVCEQCAARIRKGRETGTLLTSPESGRRRWARPRPVPYYEVDSVWARTGFGALGDELWRELGRERGRERGGRS